MARKLRYITCNNDVRKYKRFIFYKNKRHHHNTHNKEKNYESGSTYGDGRGILGEYDFFLDLAGIDDLFWNADGINDISFMVETVTPFDLGLTANTTYNGEMGFNYFSAPHLFYGFDPNANGGAATPEPATLAVFGLGLAGLGLARARRNRKS